MKERKILIEVNNQEYQKIISGALEKNDERPSLSQFTVEELVREIIKRTPEEDKHYEEYYDAISDRIIKSLVGKLKLTFDVGEQVIFSYTIANKEK